MGYIELGNVGYYFFLSFCPISREKSNNLGLLACT